jgi:transposase-like protein
VRSLVLSFKLSYRKLVAMMGERGIGLAHTTILRWVQHYTPEFEKRWNRYARCVGGSWRCAETYIKVKGDLYPVSSCSCTCLAVGRR